MCDHHYVISNYDTQICTRCGVEKALGLTPQIDYGQSTPLIIGYSRGTRFKMLLDKLFRPLLYGKMNSEVLESLYRISPNTFKNGYELLEWLGRLNIPNKCYQSAHSYFLFHTGNKVMPTPSAHDIHNIELQFVRLETKFLRSCEIGSSFFSYNWLLRKLLLKHNQTYYIQFVKPIKCKRRSSKYNLLFSSLMNVDSVSGLRDSLRNCQKQPDELQGDDSLCRLKRYFFLNRLVKTLPSMGVLS